MVECNGIISFFLGVQYYEVRRLSRAKEIIDGYFDLKKN